MTLADELRSKLPIVVTKHMTLADELRSKLPIVVTKNVEVEEEKPRPLNGEALEVILQLALDASEEGYGSMRIFLDGNYEQWGLLDKPTV